MTLPLATDGGRNEAAATDAQVGVVGAGMTGLALTHFLAERGVPVRTVEADAEPGGVVRSRERAGTVLEVGPQRFRLTDGVGELADAAGVREALITAPADLSLYVYADGALREVPRTPTGFLRTDLLSWRGKLRILAEPLTDPIDPDESAGAALARKFGDDAYRNLVEPLYGGTYASDPAEMPARHALGPVMDLEDAEGSLLRPALRRLLARDDHAAPVAVEGGNQRLPDGLYKRHAGAIDLDTPAEAVRPTGGDGGPYDLETAAGTHRVDDVVVTAPAPAAADVLEPVAPDAADRVRQLTYNPLAYVYLRADVDRRGLGYQVRRGEGFHTLGVTWNGCAFDRDSLCTAFFGGMTDSEVLDRDDESLGRLAAEEFEAIVGAPAEVIEVVRDPDAIPAYDQTWSALDGLELPDGVHLATNYTARLGVPSRIREARALARRLADDRPGEGESGTPAAVP
ncbi:MAG: protoporphyrinogen oxidase [Halobacteriaceae archaeon]